MLWLPSWRIKIYITATIQAQLLCTAFTKLHEVGIRAMALVMDGHATNQAMVLELGGCLLPGNIITDFEHPSESAWRIYIFFDPCHMLKPLRNALEAMRNVSLPGIGTARWSDIVKLHKLQRTEGLRAANERTDAHVHLQQQKIKVHQLQQYHTELQQEKQQFYDTTEHHFSYFIGFLSIDFIRRK